MLLDADYTACLADFGYASLMGDISEALTHLHRSTTRPGALRWVAPEQIDQTVLNRTTKSDIYSFGCIALQGSLLDANAHPMLMFLQVLSGKQPWSEVREDAAIVVRLADGKNPGRPESRRIDDSHWNLIQRCWSPVAQRPAADRIISTIERFLSVFSRPPHDMPTSTRPVHASSLMTDASLSLSRSSRRAVDIPVNDDQTRYTPVHQSSHSNIPNITRPSRSHNHASSGR